MPSNSQNNISSSLKHHRPPTSSASRHCPRPNQTQLTFINISSAILHPPSSREHDFINHATLHHPRKPPATAAVISNPIITKLLTQPPPPSSITIHLLHPQCSLFSNLAITLRKLSRCRHLHRRKAQRPPPRRSHPPSNTIRLHLENTRPHQPPQPPTQLLTSVNTSHPPSSSSFIIHPSSHQNTAFSLLHPKHSSSTKPLSPTFISAPSTKSNSTSIKNEHQASGHHRPPMNPTTLHQSPINTNPATTLDLQRNLPPPSTSQ